MTLLSRATLSQFATSSLPAFTRLGTAAFVGDGVENFKRPEKMLELYEFQGQRVECGQLSALIRGAVRFNRH